MEKFKLRFNKIILKTAFLLLYSIKKQCLTIEILTVAKVKG